MASATTRLKLNILNNFQEQMGAMMPTEGLSLGPRALRGVQGLRSKGGDRRSRGAGGEPGVSGVIEEAGGRNELLQRNKYP